MLWKMLWKNLFSPKLSSYCYGTVPEARIAIDFQEFILNLFQSSFVFEIRLIRGYGLDRVFSLLVRCLILKVCSGYFQQNLSDQNSSELEKFSAPYRHPLSPSIPASTSDHTATHCAKTNFDGARDQARIDLIGLNQKEDFYCRECSPSVDQSQISCSSTFH